MFIYCIDEDLKKELIEKGFKLIKEDSTGAVFARNKKIDFDFSKVDKTKVIFTNKLNFM